MAGMKRYSIDTNVREKAVSYITLLSILAAVIMNLLIWDLLLALCSYLNLEEIYSKLVLLGIVGSTGALFFYGILWTLFDNWLWKRGIFISLHGIPNLNGKWSGKLTSSYRDENGKNVVLSAEMSITQTFSKMDCVAEFGTSRGDSCHIAMYDCNPQRKSCHLDISFLNTAREKAVEIEGWDSEHRGVDMLFCEGDVIDGQYFTKRNNPTWGQITLKRESKS